MKYVLIIAAVFGLTFCTTDADKASEMNTLLTSTEWITIDKNINGGDLKSTTTFKADGSYRVDYLLEGDHAKPLAVKGTWTWISETELSIIHQALVVDGVEYNTKDTRENAHIVRITELSKNNLKGLRRFNKDSEDSGFVNPVSFTSAAL